MLFEDEAVRNEVRGMAAGLTPDPDMREELSEVGWIALWERCRRSIEFLLATMGADQVLSSRQWEASS